MVLVPSRGSKSPGGGIPVRVTASSGSVNQRLPKNFEIGGLKVIGSGAGFGAWRPAGVVESLSTDDRGNHVMVVQLRGAPVAVRVFSPRGEPVSDFSVGVGRESGDIELEDAEWFLQRVDDPAASQSERRVWLPPGRWHFRVESTHGKRGEVEIDVPADGHLVKVDVNLR